MNSKIFNQETRAASKDKQRTISQVKLSNSKKDNSRRIRMVIGLDFGTSFSKVVIGESRVRYAVPFYDHTADIIHCFCLQH